MSLLPQIAMRQKDYRSYRPLTIVCLGDSVTHGCFETFIGKNGDLDCVYDCQNVYHTKLKEKMAVLFGSVPINVINAGISGDNAPGAFARLDRDVLSFNPQLVTVYLGLNDAMNGKEGIHTYRDALSQIFSSLKSHNIETIFITPNMLATELDTTICDKNLQNIALKAASLQNDGTMDLYIETAKTVCASYDIPVCDFYATWKTIHTFGGDITRLLSNRINHPTKEMHELLAQMLMEKLLTSPQADKAVE